MADSVPLVGPIHDPDHDTPGPYEYNSSATPLVGAPEGWDVMSYNSSPYDVEGPVPSSPDHG